MPASFTFSSDGALIDRDRVHAWLSEESPWAKGRSRALQDAAIDASRNYSVRDAEDRQVAYGRIVTDGATFAWLCDVFVDEAVRGRGVGKMLVEGIVDDMQKTSVTRIILATSNAHGLYRQYGFAPSDDPERYMIRTMAQ